MGIPYLGATRHEPKRGQVERRVLVGDEAALHIQEQKQRTIPSSTCSSRFARITVTSRGTATVQTITVKARKPYFPNARICCHMRGQKCQLHSRDSVTTLLSALLINKNLKILEKMRSGVNRASTTLGEEPTTWEGEGRFRAGMQHKRITFRFYFRTTVCCGGPVI